MPLGAVTFDFWQTLVAETPEATRRNHARRVNALAAVLARAGCARPRAAVVAAYDRCGMELERCWRTNREMQPRAQVRLILDGVEPGLSDRLEAAELEAAVEGYVMPLLTFPPALMPHAAEAVQSLAERGLKLGIVSNTGRTPGAVLRRVLDGYGLLRYFSAISYSDEVGWRKPASEIFMATLGALGVPASRTLHVGDNPDADVEGARRVGMLTAHLAVGGAPAAERATVVLSGLGELSARLAGLVG
ncbi:MAG: HAD family hydrolase [Candidatus Rokubacteria bacterium]|nr:HAD family hydrolase [Candidatus Rokubacteria bacterium]MBI3825804.1 HAD family hydrolase [Candidatus Rokubacteria bacterium]